MCAVLEPAPAQQGARRHAEGPRTDTPASPGRVTTGQQSAVWCVFSRLTSRVIAFFWGERLLRGVVMKDPETRQRPSPDQGSPRSLLTTCPTPSSFPLTLRASGALGPHTADFKGQPELLSEKVCLSRRGELDLTGGVGAAEVTQAL